MLNVELKQVVLDALDDLKGQEVTCIDVSDQTEMTDFMIIATGTSNRHVKSLVERVAEASDNYDLKPLGIEGLEQSEWVLIDLVDVVVHVMWPDVREFYDLEKLWTLGPRARKSTI